jgi:hypothetical protein
MHFGIYALQHVPHHFWLLYLEDFSNFLKGLIPSNERLTKEKKIVSD